MDFGRELENRVKGVQSMLDSGKIDALYVSNPKNVLYLSGRESGRILLTKNRGFLWVRDLYIKLYSNLYNSKRYPLEVILYNSDEVVKKVKSLRCRKLGVDNVNLSYYNKIRSSFKCRLRQTSVVEEKRSVKTGYEIRMLEKSAFMASKGMKKAYDVVRTGVRELDAIAEIECAIRRMGSETPPFQEGMHLASGSRGADIHPSVTKVRIKRGLVVVDLGARYNGYYSDMTRTIAVGKKSGREQELVEFVRNLELEAIDRIQPRMKASEVHNFIESEIKKKDLEFYHSAGHGIGLEVHEKPGLNLESNEILKENMVFTVEPGVYLPNRFGVRFEDMVLLTKKGCKTLTK